MSARASNIVKARVPVPGCGARPERAGLYWVADGDREDLMAVVEGEAPFCTVRLIDPWDASRPQVNLTHRRIEELRWLGEVPGPGGRK